MNHAIPPQSIAPQGLEIACFLVVCVHSDCVREFDQLPCPTQSANPPAPKVLAVIPAWSAPEALP